MNIKQAEKTKPEVKDNVISVCCYCWPGKTALEAFPELRESGKQLSHGCCKAHKETMLAMLAA